MTLDTNDTNDTHFVNEFSVTALQCDSLKLGNANPKNSSIFIFIYYINI